jgi:hypothetical protein
MSLLPATSHANPTTPFWATAGSGGGGGNAPILITGTLARIEYNPADDGTYQITTFTCPVNLLDGNYVVTATFSLKGGGSGNNTVFQIIDGPSGINVTNTATYSTSIEFVNATTMMTFPFSASLGDDIPIFEFNISNADAAGNSYVYLSYNIVFYPNP